MAKQVRVKDARIMPLLPLRGIVVYPHMILHFDVGRVKSIKAIEEAMLKEQLIFLAAQKDPNMEDPQPEDIYAFGTISKIKQLLRLPGDTIRVLVEGIERARISSVLSDDPFYTVKAASVRTPKVSGGADIQALSRQVVEHFEKYAKLSGKISADATLSITAIDDLSRLPDVIASNLAISIEQKQEILEEVSTYKRLETLLDILVSENEILEIEKNISSKVRQQIDKNQKEYYLREQIKAIQKELGDGSDNLAAEVEEYRDKIMKMNLSEEVRKKALKEADRLSRMHASSAESGVIRTYIETILELPWDKKTDERLDIKHAADILERDHFGLSKVKERILEYLAVRKMRNGLHGPILCLAGPPGVGKTSIVRSIAESLNRNYVRMSLGGVRDEAEIRGHRRTYVGAMPGRIINAMKQAGSSNPLILLDEIDKMASDYRGDPASAMLEVLDGEQNKDFRDHYLELPYDLSDVMFITTANYKEAIPRPLLDRMEVIDISGYTEEEKVNISCRHLIPKQLVNHGITPSQVRFDESGVRDIIVHYTREAGVRNLERSIATVLRKSAKQLVSGEKKTIRITEKTVKQYLGARKFLYDKANEMDEVGIVRGLAWTPVGGDTMPIEVNIMPGEGFLELTGQLGDVMKESARIARSYIRSIAVEIGIPVDFHKKIDMHIHVPEGAIPKDGPSAGITLATAMISAVTGIPARKNVAMTGEITLRGKVLPIGGLKEKVLAAHRAGVDLVLIPKDNKKDIEDIPENVREVVRLIPVATMEEVLKYALVKKPAPRKEEPRSEASAVAEAKEEAAVSLEH